MSAIPRRPVQRTRIIRILRELHEDVKATRAEWSARVDEMAGGLDETGRTVGQTNRLGRLERRQVETEARLSAELASVTAAVRELEALLVEDRNR
jgi:hypothetical protein